MLPPTNEDERRGWDMAMNTLLQLYNHREQSSRSHLQKAFNEELWRTYMEINQGWKCPSFLDASCREMERKLAKEIEEDRAA